MLKICVWIFFATVATSFRADLKKWPPLPAAPRRHRPIDLCLCVELHHTEDNTYNIQIISMVPTDASRMCTSHYVYNGYLENTIM